MKPLKLCEYIYWDFANSLIVDGEKCDLKKNKFKLKSLFKNRDLDKEAQANLWVKNYHRYNVKRDWNLLDKEVQFEVLKELFGQLDKKSSYNQYQKKYLLSLVLWSDYFGLKDINSKFNGDFEQYNWSSIFREVIDVDYVREDKEEDIQFFFDCRMDFSSWGIELYDKIEHLFTDKHYKRNKYTSIYYKIDKESWYYSNVGLGHRINHMSQEDKAIVCAQLWYSIEGVDRENYELTDKAMKLLMGQKDFDIFKERAKKYIFVGYHSVYDLLWEDNVRNYEKQGLFSSAKPQNTFVIDRLHSFVTLNNINIKDMKQALYSMFDFKRNYPTLYNVNIERVIFREYFRNTNFLRKVNLNLLSNFIHFFKQLNEENKSYFEKHIYINHGLFRYFTDRGYNVMRLKNIDKLIHIMNTRGLYKLDGMRRVMDSLISTDLREIYCYDNKVDDAVFKTKHLYKYFKEKLVINKVINIRDLTLLSNVMNSRIYRNKNMLQNEIINIFKRMKDKMSIEFEPAIYLDGISILENNPKSYSKVIKLIREESDRIASFNDRDRRNDKGDYAYWEQARSNFNDASRIAKDGKRQGSNLVYDYNYSSIHDLHEYGLSVMKRYREANVRFKKRYKSIKSDRFIFLHARTKNELIEWGGKLSHCIGGYWRKALRGNSILMGIKSKKNNKLLYTLEIREGRLIQLYGLQNKYPPKEDAEYIKAKLIKVGLVNDKENSY